MSVKKDLPLLTPIPGQTSGAKIPDLPFHVPVQPEAKTTKEYPPVYNLNPGYKAPETKSGVNTAKRFARRAYLKSASRHNPSPDSSTDVLLAKNLEAITSNRREVYLYDSLERCLRKLVKNKKLTSLLMSSGTRFPQIQPGPVSDEARYESLRALYRFKQAIGLMFRGNHDRAIALAAIDELIFQFRRQSIESTKDRLFKELPKDLKMTNEEVWSLYRDQEQRFFMALVDQNRVPLYILGKIDFVFDLSQLT